MTYQSRKAFPNVRCTEQFSYEMCYDKRPYSQINSRNTLFQLSFERSSIHIIVLSSLIILTQHFLK